MDLGNFLIVFGAGWLAAMLSVAACRVLLHRQQRVEGVRHWNACLHDSHVERMR